MKFIFIGGVLAAALALYFANAWPPAGLVAAHLLFLYCPVVGGLWFVFRLMDNNGPASKPFQPAEGERGYAGMVDDAFEDHEKGRPQRRGMVDDDI